MARESLLEYFEQPTRERAHSRPEREIAVAWRRGYRMVRWSYAELLRVAAQFAIELEAQGIAKGDRVLLWGENSGEWVAAFLGCMFRGAIAVPMDAIAERTGLTTARILPRLLELELRGLVRRMGGGRFARVDRSC